MGKGTSRVSRRTGYLSAVHDEHNEASPLIMLTAAGALCVSGANL
jgi:hypothetical protein